MVSLKKYVPCKCGANNFFEFNSDMAVEDITLSARCPSCGANITISISALLSAPAQPQAPSVPVKSEPSSSADSTLASSEMDAQTKENVEEAVRDIFRY